VNCPTSTGMTGTMMPMATMSSSTVNMMKGMAALRVARTALELTGSSSGDEDKVGSVKRGAFWIVVHGFRAGTLPASRQSEESLHPVVG
jgi:hypothetical protein